MALNFPDSPTNGQKYTDPVAGETWTYESATNSWTSDGLTTAVGIQYKGGIDITAAPPAGVANGWQYTVTTGGTANAGFTGLSGNIAAGTTILYDGANWQQAGAGVKWDRTGTALKPVNAGDTVQISAGTAALPGLTPVGDPNTGVWAPAADTVAVSTNGVQRATVDSSGKLLVGTSSSSATATAIFQGNSAGTDPGIVYITTKATAPADGVALGLLRFTAANHSTAAQIEATRDGGTWTVGSSQPTRFVISTTPDGSATPQERLRITADGKLGLGTSSPDTLLHLEANNDSSATNNALRFTNTDTTSGVGDTVGLIEFETRDATAPGVNAQIEASFAGSNGTGRLQFRTGQPGSLNNSMIIDQDGKLGVGTSAPGSKLHIYEATGGIACFTNIGAASYGSLELGVDVDGCRIRAVETSDPIYFQTGGSESARIDTSGRLLLGTSTAPQVLGLTHRFNVAVGAEAAALVGRWDNSKYGPSLTLAKSRGTSVGTSTVLASGDQIGLLVFAGADGVNMTSVGAEIRAEVDGAPAAGSLPGELLFSTTPVGGTSASPRMRIKNNGIVNIANAPTYADNTAATAGGLVAGDIYRKADGTLMITF